MITRKYKKKAIPKALREAMWLKHNGKVFEAKCATRWCPNKINAYNVQAGHNIPESKGGTTTLENLYPICSRCNLSMGNSYTFDEWSTLGRPSWFSRWFGCCYTLWPSFLSKPQIASRDKPQVDPYA